MRAKRRVFNSHSVKGGFVDKNPRKLPKQARSKALVEAVLDASARVLAKDGRDALTTNVIAQAAGVSVGSLYQYFPNREAILSALVHRHGHRIHALVTEAMHPQPAALEEAVSRLVAAVFAAHRLDPALHDALDHDFAGEDLGHHHITTKQAVVAQIEALGENVRREIGAGRSPQVASEIMHGLAHAALVHPHEGDDPALIEQEAIRATLAYLRS